MTKIDLFPRQENPYEKIPRRYQPKRPIKRLIRKTIAILIPGWTSKGYLRHRLRNRLDPGPPYLRK